jgi:sortase A
MLKRTLQTLLLITILVVCVFAFTTTSYTISPLPSQKQQVSEQQQAIISPVTIDFPKTLIIEKFSINAPIEFVGLDSQKRMDIPKNVDDVAWYKLGPKPGQIGSAVIAGHYDKADGSPAVFWDLSKIQIGDEIKIIDKSNNEHRFRVINVKNFPYDQIPLKEIFASSDKARLNLITCAGVWNENSKNYSNRTVIYTELVK